MTPWALDRYQGTLELVPVHHATIKVNDHAAKNLAGSFGASFFYRPELTTELSGLHAKTQLHTEEPVFFLHSDEEEDSEGDDGGDTHTEVVVTAVRTKDHRVVTQINYNQLTNKGEKKDTRVPMQVESLGQGWTRLTPESPLPPGEYVLLSQPDRGAFFAGVVYPFGIAADAPPDPGAVSAHAAPAGPSPCH